MEKKFEDENYAINFTLQDKYFKKLMTSINERCKKNCEFKYNSQEDGQKSDGTFMEKRIRNYNTLKQQFSTLNPCLTEANGKLILLK
jgi:hypothetical protein